MRVLMLTPQLPSPATPGSMAPTARQIESLRRLGVEIRVIEMRGWPVLKYAAGLRSMRRHLRDADLIHAHFGYCGWLACLQLHKPVVISFMGSDVYGDQDSSGRSDLLSALMAYTHRRWLAPRADAVIVKSRQMAELLAPTPCQIIANGVELEAFCPLEKAAARRQLGWQLDRPYVLFPGNPANSRKGFVLARDTLDWLNANYSQHVELVALWNVPPDEVPRYMNACDVMLMVSRAEGSPNVVKEAMACNTPIVAVPVGDVEWLLDGADGCLVRQRDPAVLGAAIRELLTRHHRSNGRAVIQRLHLDAESVARRVLAIYESVLATHGLGDSQSLPGSFTPETSR